MIWVESRRTWKNNIVIATLASEQYSFKQHNYPKLEERQENLLLKLKEIDITSRVIIRSLQR